MAQDLWNKAVESLNDEDKQAIDFSRDKPAVLSDVLQAAEQKKQICMQRRWKFTKKNGDVVILRDVCEKLIKWVNKFKEVGDLAIQYDPAHASLPWAAVRFFLQFSVNDVQTFGAIAEGLELVSSQISRCALYEQLYLFSRQSVATSDFKAALLRLYTAVLVYLARARRYYAKGTLQRLGASVTNTSTTVQACLDKISIERDDVERCVGLFDSELLASTSARIGQVQTSVSDLASNLKSLQVDTTASQASDVQALKALFTSFELPILRTGTQLSHLHDNLLKVQRREILAWLSNIRYREHHQSSFSAVMPGSCTWLQGKPEYVEWKSSSSSSILWIHGIPGSGKSKLMSTVIQSLLESKSPQLASSAVAYFYCAQDVLDLKRADPNEVMRAVLKQLACFDASQPVHPTILREYDKRRRDADEDGLEPTQLSLHECKNMILEITDQEPAVIAIDALDECDPFRRHELLQALRHIVEEANSLVKVIVSSRDDADVVHRLNNVPYVYIRSNDNGEDVDKFIDFELERAIREQRLLRGRVAAVLKERILQTLKDGANGMFLWASLQIQNLCDPERMILASDVEDALLRLPPTLGQLYSVIIERIDRIAPRGRRLARKALRWLLCAREPLTPPLMIGILEHGSQEASDAQPIIMDEVLSLCCNLVILDDTLNIFRFAHASIQEFLQQQPDFEAHNINVQAAEETLQFVQSAAQSPWWSYDLWYYRNRDYATHYWMVHYRELGFDFRSTHPLAIRVHDFFLAGANGDKTFLEWAVQVYSKAKHRHKSASCWTIPLDVACAHGLSDVVDKLVEVHLIEFKTSWSGSCLYHAVCKRNVDIVQRLLSLDADPKEAYSFGEWLMDVAEGENTIEVNYTMEFLRCLPRRGR